MLIPDVTIFLGAFAAAESTGSALRAWMQEALSGTETVGVSELVLSAVVRVSTNRRSYPTPATPVEALEFCRVVRDAPAARIVAPGSRNWQIFADLVRDTHATANLVPDAYLAALSIENGATFVTRDRGFARYPGLRTLDPLAP